MIILQLRVHVTIIIPFSVSSCFSRISVFLQAEDGIRDWSVTGVQTCALLFSSRRRHTRLVSDWSSDVCSSDLMIRRPPISYAVFCLKKKKAKPRRHSINPLDTTTLVMHYDTPTLKDTGSWMMVYDWWLMTQSA